LVRLAWHRQHIDAYDEQSVTSITDGSKFVTVTWLTKPDHRSWQAKEQVSATSTAQILLTAVPRTPGSVA
jgi:hypothetical protein